MARKDLELPSGTNQTVRLQLGRASLEFEKGEFWTPLRIVGSQVTVGFFRSQTPAKNTSKPLSRVQWFLGQFYLCSPSRFGDFSRGPPNSGTPLSISGTHTIPILQGILMGVVWEWRSHKWGSLEFLCGRLWWYQVIPTSMVKRLRTKNDQVPDSNHCRVRTWRSHCLVIVCTYDLFIVSGSGRNVCGRRHWQPCRRSRGSLLMIQLAQLHRHPGIYERPTECPRLKSYILGAVWVGFGWIFRCILYN